MRNERARVISRTSVTRFDLSFFQLEFDTLYTFSFGQQGNVYFRIEKLRARNWILPFQSENINVGEMNGKRNSTTQQIWPKERCDSLLFRNRLTFFIRFNLQRKKPSFTFFNNSISKTAEPFQGSSRQQPQPSQ